MNYKEYIETGVLELYVAGTLSPSERQEVEAMAIQHIEVKQEIEAIEKAFEAYATLHARAPKKELLTSILAEITASAEKTDKTSAKTIQLKPEPIKSISPALRYLAYAATLLLIVSAAINIYYYNSYSRVKDELALMQTNNLQMADQYNTVKASYDQLASDMNIMKSPEYMPVTMKGMPIKPDALAVVYWDKTTGDIYVNAMNLPAPEHGKQYQLWALKDGKPIDAGVFEMNGKMQPMKNITEADAFAVTLEPMGGSVAPTLDKLYVFGNV